MKILEVQENGDNKYGVKIKLKNSICNKTVKKKLWHNLKTQDVMQQKKNVGKKTQDLAYGKT